MLSFRRLRLCLGILTSILVMSGFAVAQDASVRKELEALYAKRDKAIKEKDVAAFRSIETADFESVLIFPNLDFTADGQAGLKKGDEARADAESFVITDVKEVTSFATTIRSIKQGRDAKQFIVESTEHGEIVQPSGSCWTAYCQDLVTLTGDGWKIRRHGRGMAGCDSGSEYVAVDNSVWDDFKALYEKRDKAFADKDLSFIKSLETDEYTEESTTPITAAGNGGDPVTLSRSAADGQTGKILKRNGVSLVTKIWGVQQGKDKNEAIVKASGVLDYKKGEEDESEAVITTDTWTRAQSGWKLKSRR